MISLLHFSLHKNATAAGTDAAAEDVSAGHYGNLPLNQSQSKDEKEFTELMDVCKAKAEKSVWIRGRLHTSRSKG